MFQSENESNEEDYTRSPVLLDLDENSKQHQQKAAGEMSLPSSAVNQQDQGLLSGAWTYLELSFTSQVHRKIIYAYYVSFK